MSGSTEDEQDTAGGARAGALRRLVRVAVVLAGLVIAVTTLWWAVGRLSAPSRSLTVVRADAVAAPAPAADATPTTLRILTWNIAHGRGIPDYGLLRNFSGGGAEVRQTRLRRIADVIREQDADLVVLNEADFDATWSHGVNHAARLAEWAGYPIRVEQTNYDVRLPFAEFHFGNALLSRLPVREVRAVELPPHRRFEAVLVGAKTASVIRLATAGGPLSLIPLHLEARSPRTRQAALPRLLDVAEVQPPPLVVAGDFNASPPTWGDPVQRVGLGRGSPSGDGGARAAPSTTVVGQLVDSGFRSPRVHGEPGPEEWTYPAPRPDRAIDWVMVEPPLEVVEAHVVRDPGIDTLSDHRPVLSVVRLPTPGADVPSDPPGGERVP